MFRNMKIRLKLVLSFGLIICLLILSLAVGTVNMQRASSNMQYYVENAVPSINAIWTARRSMVSAERYFYKAANTSDLVKTGEYIDAAQADLDTLEDVFPIIEKDYGGNKQDPATFRQLMDSTTTVKEQVFSLLRTNKNTEGLALFESQYSPTFSKAITLLIEMSNGIMQRAGALSDQTERANTVAIMFLVFIGIISMIIAIAVCTAITRSIMLPVSQLNRAAQMMSDGLLKVNIDYVSNDELGEVCQNLRKTTEILDSYITDVGRGMSAIADGNLSARPSVEFKGDFIALRDSIMSVMFSLNNTLTQIGQSSSQVASGSEQVSSGAQALSQGATEQASSIQELSATITEIYGQVKNNAENAQSARDQSTNAEGEILASNEKMQEMISAMSDISSRSSEIGKIIKTIEDIAFQTNILALNAAVEAARAGAAGKGFAVVADEVRNLASKSAEAAKNTTSLIEETIYAVEHGTKIAGETAESIISIVQGARQVTNLIDKIANASADQSISLNQVTQGADQIASVIQTNSATAEESAAASEELSSQAQILERLVSAFTLVEVLDATPLPEISNNYIASNNSTHFSPSSPINF